MCVDDLIASTMFISAVVDLVELTLSSIEARGGPRQLIL